MTRPWRRVAWALKILTTHEKRGTCASVKCHLEILL